MSSLSDELALLGGPRSCKYGAPMGSACLIKDMEEPFRIFRCSMRDGGYLVDGSYFGTPANIYCAVNSCGERGFTRASSRKAAMDYFDKTFPGIRWLHRQPRKKPL